MKPTSSEYTSSLLVHHIASLRYREKRSLYRCVSHTEDFLHLSKKDIEDILKRPIRSSFSLEKIYRHFERTVKILQHKKIRWISCLDKDFPEELLYIDEPPFGLFVLGYLPPSVNRAIGIVGTRNPLQSSLSEVHSIAYDLSGAGVSVISGLARGIDAASHRGALKQRGHTFAILGNGINYIYPKVNLSLAHQIVANGGGLISEYLPDCPAHRYHFPQRNRIIAGLSRGVVLWEAPQKSGSLITMRYALEEGKDVFVNESFLDEERFGGNAKLLAEGALGVRRANDVLSLWGLPLLYRSQEEKSFSAKLPPSQQIVQNIKTQLHI